MTRATPNAISHASLEQAASWYVQLNDQQSSQQEREHWQAWLAQSGEHQAAWHYVERVSQRFAVLQDNQQQAASHVLRNSGRASLNRRQTVKSLLVLVSGGWLGWSAWKESALPLSLARWTADLSTGTGETRETRLSDGSRIWLNALSALNVHFDTAQRLLLLQAGEVLIDAAKDTSRPLLVQTVEGRMRALGTRFSVRQEDRRTLLNVYEGAVEVRTAQGQVQVAEAAQQLSFSQDHIPPPSVASASREAWRRGLLLADNLPLGQLLEELSRYRPGHLGCDPAVAGLPVMVSFPLKDTDQALRLLEAALPVRVHKPLEWWVDVGPKA
ncbi:iron dicitrate transport regulator FecR [Pseudomonas jessenii]|uniref:Iron dicitrate transport regulator FecR n=1 Tax=Pseudomonas jessenii TaxID=77298 RepID=A0A2W0ENP0_PSEJE|nr:FecR domain-containing protein [Pseudomonas jessenii]PYY69566.1 iron dicitrate transport regulator FecR [Pseudomonas jessenii]